MDGVPQSLRLFPGPDQSPNLGDRRGNSSGTASRATEGPRPHSAALQGGTGEGPFPTPRRWGRAWIWELEAHAFRPRGPGVYRTLRRGGMESFS